MAQILKKAQNVLNKPQRATQKGQESSRNEKIKQLGEFTHDTLKGHFTTDTGFGVDNTDVWLKATGERQGPALLEDHHAREKIHHFDHERIPERVVHARGAAAHGVFRLFQSASDVTYAKVLTDTSRETPIFLRFSTVLGSRGCADTVRDVYGFACRFYTPEGNWDIVGNNIAVFFIQDAIKFPDVIHSGKGDPRREVPQAQSAHNNFWDFAGSHSEAAHITMWAMSDRAVPRSYRMMQGFGVNTYCLVNAKKERVFVKFHFTPELGVHSLLWDEVLKLAGQDPDFLRKDLYAAIDNGAFPKWKFGIQVLPESRQDEFDFDILDATKIWPEEDVPVRYIGEIELNRNIDEFFTETEQVAYCTSNIIPGVDFSDDPLLQGRNFSYVDTQINRFTSFNFNDLPINRPICPVLNHQRDGVMKYRITKGSVNYHPNRFNAVSIADDHSDVSAFRPYPGKVAGIKQRMNGPKFKEHFNQATLYYNSLAPHEKDHLISAINFELGKCDDEKVRSNAVKALNNIDYDLAKTVALNIGVDPPTEAVRPNHGKKSSFLSQTAYAPKTPTIVSRRIAILVADGFNLAQVTAARAALSNAGAWTFLVGPRRGPIKPAGQRPAGQRAAGQEDGLRAEYSFETGRSTLFDSIYVPGGSQSVMTLKENSRAIYWVREAFHHLKAIAASGEGVEFISRTCELADVRFAQQASSQPVVDYGVVTQWQYSPSGTSKLKLPGGEDFLSLFAKQISQHRCWPRAPLAVKVPA